VVEHCKIANSKHQIPNKSQNPISKDKGKFGILQFGHCNLFGICALLFGIFGHSTLQNSGDKDCWTFLLAKQSGST
jgi:hypothetical protein